jgi:hypothetical protein
LRGNSRLKSFNPSISRNVEVENREMLAIAGTLRENKGIVDVHLTFSEINGETLYAVCDSLKTHPTLEVLNLRGNHRYEADTAPSAEITSRIQALLDMVKVYQLQFFTRHLTNFGAHYEPRP